MVRSADGLRGCGSARDLCAWRRQHRRRLDRAELISSYRPASGSTAAVQKLVASPCLSVAQSAHNDRVRRSGRSHWGFVSTTLVSAPGHRSAPSRFPSSNPLTTRGLGRRRVATCDQQRTIGPTRTDNTGRQVLPVCSRNYAIGTPLFDIRTTADVATFQVSTSASPRTESRDKYASNALAALSYHVTRA